MHREPLNLSHQTLLIEKLRKIKVPISEYTFANLYLFRHLHQYELIFADELFIRGRSRDGFFFIMLTALPYPEMMPLLISLLKKEADFIFPIPNEWISLFNPSLFQFSFKEEESDYLFQTLKLATFSGRHLSNKRNLVKQLLSSHHVKAEPLELAQQDAAWHALEEWQREQTTSREETDYFACQEAIQLGNKLFLECYLFYVEGQPKGLIIGEQLNEDCYVVHFAKATKHIKGLYQYLYQELAQRLIPNYHWINLEQDMGSLTIRQAKHSYQPNRLIHKMRIHPIN